MVRAVGDEEDARGEDGWRDVRWVVEGGREGMWDLGAR